MMTIQLNDALAERLRRAAAATGDPPEALAERVLEQHLPLPGQATLDLFRQWEEEEAKMTPEELARANTEGQQFMENLAKNRIESEGPNARRLWP